MTQATLIEHPSMVRGASLQPQTFDSSANTIDVVFTTGATVRRYDLANRRPFDEELVVTPQSVRLERLNRGAPFLNAHHDGELAGVIGVVVPASARIVDGKGLAQIKLSSRPEAAGIVQDIADGVIRNISCGYRYHRIEVEQRDNDVSLYHVTDWEPLELSAVAIGADPGAQTRAGEPGDCLFPCTIITRGLPRAATPAALALIRMRMCARELGLKV
jgi:Caudovirus prohead serine protease